MSTPQSIAHVTPRLRIGLGRVLTALGILVAVATTVIILALTGAHHASVATPVAPTNAGVTSRPHTHYLGPRQMHAALNPQSSGVTLPTAGTGNPAPTYICLGASKRCLRR
jgi:hypothetical protein